MAISITPSPFGSVTVTLDGELGGVLSVGVLATSNSALNMAFGIKLKSGVFTPGFDDFVVSRATLGGRVGYCRS